ncbi:hypothetical protein FSP39_018460 [Pinctada imbricata]|uniref:Uncharacterized protein n=1 Tax=Pinctada imbricata TaxID=66713 RepID=A0AA89C3Y8_PINIB|nr:hypothetical protein FSP39_018460 [Pinctada imbricata]
MPQTQRSVHINRRQTIPCSKEDGVKIKEMMRSRENVSTLLEDTEKMATKPPPGPKRRTLNRTDSYREATTKANRISMVDPLEKFRKENYKKEKYISLPNSRKRRDREETKKKPSRVGLLRQESGVVPSPDTDDDQVSVVSDRKKKSPIKKAKERIIHTFRKQSVTEDEKAQKKREKAMKELKKRKRAPSDISQSLPDLANQLVVKPLTRSESKRTKTGHIYSSMDVIAQSGPSSDLSKSRLGRLPSIKNPLSRNKVSSPESSHQRTGWSLQKEDTWGKVERQDIKDKPVQMSQDSDKVVDDVNEIFSNILFSDLEVKTCKRKRSTQIRSTTRHNTTSSRIVGDRTKLSLNLQNTTLGKDLDQADALTHREPMSPDGVIRQELGTIQIHSDLEVDGENGSDAPDEKQASGCKKSAADDKDIPFSALSFDEKDKRTTDVANRLKVLADKYVAKIQSESSQSDVESPRSVIGGIISPVRQDMDVVAQLVAEFRKEGDRLSRELDLDNSMTPLILQVAQQSNTYAGFKSVFQNALRDTIGWDQIAMYYYVSRTAIHVAGASSTLARMTVDYFKERYAGWIRERGGWESMIEETDSELD